ncbi:hypothetical protein B0H63DRAFT_517096 [Podospora didyma]|uniref:Uncharacterized protein n=1 Tax=Podospora didyma TaxID=330526 RepID=A0AAE0P628_9PEZI|nr:hypothetical protein B0H63DRAFT_517096 [Podospora didyma]
MASANAPDTVDILSTKTSEKAPSPDQQPAPLIKVRTTHSDQLGFKLLYPPPNSNVDIKIDIVAIHDIAAGPDQTWVRWEKAKSPTEQDLTTNWLADTEMLPAAKIQSEIKKIARCAIEAHESAKSKALVSGGSREFERSFIAIAEALGIRHTKAASTNLLRAVRLYLGQEANGDLLMIVDGVDRDDPLDAPNHHISELSGQKPLFQYIPVSPAGGVLFTAKSRSLAPSLANQKDECVIDLEKRLKIKDTTLERSPLAVPLAASYIASQELDFGIHEYLDAMAQCTIHHIDKQNIGEAALEKAWRVSYMLIKDTLQDSEAARLMLVLGTFGVQCIPKFILAQGKGEMEKLQVRRKKTRAMLLYNMAGYSKLLKRYEEALQYLEECLVIREEQGDSSADGIKAELEDIRAEQQRATTPPKYDTSSGPSKPVRSAGNREWGKAIGKVQSLVRLLHALTPDQEWQENAAQAKAELDACENELGEDHLETLRKADQLAAVLHNRDEQAIAIRQHLFQQCAKIYGKHSLDTRRLEDATELFRVTFSTAETLLAPGIPELLRIFSSMALWASQNAGLKSPRDADHETKCRTLCPSNGKVDITGRDLANVLREQYHILGPDNEATLCTVASMSLNFRLKGKHKEARDLFGLELDQKRVVNKVDTNAYHSKFILPTFLFTWSITQGFLR